MQYGKWAILILPIMLGIYGYSQVKIKHTPAPETNPASGAEMYRTYCAVCHGVDGKGDGPAAPELKQALPDLTLLSKHNRGTFPNFRVSNVIQGDAEIPAHGSADMPMWGDVFRELKRDESIVKLRVHNLTEYIASIQEPTAPAEGGETAGPK